jgi:hypothetical protein
MANQFHRLQTQAELHRPERTGRGNPNNFTVADTEANFTIPEGSGLTASDFIFNPEDGQYYQDLNTGDVYRFVKYSTLAQQQTSDDFVGVFNITKREKGTASTTVPLRNDDISALSTISFTDNEQLLIQAATGESQVVVVTGDQEYGTTEFSVKVDEFANNFDIGTFYNSSPTVSRFKKGGIWEKLVEYDRDSETITNVANAGFKAESIGEITVGFGGQQTEVETSGGGTFYEYNNVQYLKREDALNAAIADGVSPFNAPAVIITVIVDPTTETKQIPREVTQITANLSAEVTEGEEITVVDPASLNSVKLTINNDGNDEISAFGPGENIVLDVQDDTIKPFFPIGSLIFGEEGYRESSIKVDPSRIQLAVLGARGGDGIGVLTQDVGEGTTSQLNLKNIDETVNIKDNQSLILLNKFGDVKQATANGAQTLSAGTGTLNINSITIASGEPIFEADTSVVKEPSYASSSRITVAEGDITLAAQEANDASSAVASLSLTVGSNSASISSQASLIDSNSSAIASTTSRVSSTETQIGTLNQSVTDIENTLEQNDVTAISGLQTSVQGIEGDIDSINATAVLKTDVDGNISAIRLDSTTGGSAINIKADQITFDGSTTFIGDFFAQDLITGASGAELQTPEGGDSPLGLSTPANADDESQECRLKFSTYSETSGSIVGGFDLLANGDANVANSMTARIRKRSSIGTLNIVLDGNVTYTGTLSSSSDKRLKGNVVPLGSALEKIAQLDAVVYDTINPDDAPDEREIGLFAQDVEPLFPEAVGERTEENEEGEEITYKTLSYIQLIPALIESVKELKQQNEELKTRIEALEQQS